MQKYQTGIHVFYWTYPAITFLCLDFWRVSWILVIDNITDTAGILSILLFIRRRWIFWQNSACIMIYRYRVQIHKYGVRDLANDWGIHFSHRVITSNSTCVDISTKDPPQQKYKNVRIAMLYHNIILLLSVHFYGFNYFITVHLGTTIRWPPTVSLCRNYTYYKVISQIQNKPSSCSLILTAPYQLCVFICVTRSKYFITVVKLWSGGQEKNTTIAM